MAKILYHLGLLSAHYHTCRDCGASIRCHKVTGECSTVCPGGCQ